MSEKKTLRQRIFSQRGADPDAPVQSVVELLRERGGALAKLALLVVLFVCLFWFQNVFIFIDSGNAGVRWRRLGGGTEMRTYGEGIHAIWPWDLMYLYEVRIQTLNINSTVYAQDGLEISVRASVRFHPNYDTLSALHKEVGPEYITRLVEPEIHSTLRKVLGNFTPNSIYAKDEQGLLEELQETMRADFNSEYVVLDKFLIMELSLPEHIQDAIQDKLEEEQRVQAYYFILEKEEYEHQRRVIEASGIRDFEEISGVNILRWRGLDVTEKLATAPNSKVVILGSGADQLPLILNTEDAGPHVPTGPPPEAPAALPAPAAPEPLGESPAP